MDCLASGEEGSANVTSFPCYHGDVARHLSKAQAKRAGEAAVDLSVLGSCCCYLQVKLGKKEVLGGGLESQNPRML